MLTLTVFLPFFGRLVDMFGRTKMYNIGFVIFTIGSALCGISPNAYFLVFSRVLQAVGAGMLQANSVAIITQSFPRNELGRAIGI
jgi:MFS family permease